MPMQACDEVVRQASVRATACYMHTQHHCKGEAVQGRKRYKVDDDCADPVQGNKKLAAVESALAHDRCRVLSCCHKLAGVTSQSC